MPTFLFATPPQGKKVELLDAKFVDIKMYVIIKRLVFKVFMKTVPALLEFSCLSEVTVRKR